MICSVCATDNESDRKFCKECGTPLALVCASCGSRNSADSKFCGECGAALPTAPATRPSTDRDGAPTEVGEALLTERRLVSVLFADLVGFTTLSEHRDPEDVRELLSRYFDATRDIVERHGGLVEKFIGDAVMAVWGTPTAHEDDAERAVRAALELVGGVEALGRDVGGELRARAGVLTGEAAAVVGAVSQGIVAGDMVNTASRLQSAAEPGAVLVGEATYRAAARAIAFADAGELTLKGKDEPVRAWRALRVVGERGGGGRIGGLEPPFVGRDEDLRLTKELLHATDREGRLRLVSVTGVGGIGKSRLAWELLKYVDGLAEDVYWHQGRCPAYGDGVSFWALGEMVRMRARIAETDDTPTARRKLSAAIRGHVTDDEERRWVEPRLAHLLGLGDRPPGEREELFTAWRTFFERISASGPVVMVFEDLQWADPGLLDFIESMLEWSRSHPILIVTLARPELTDRRPTWGSGQRSFTALHLDPLPDGAMTELVDGFVRGLPAEGTTRIVQRADGVPLYAVETVRMLADRGALEARGDAYELVGDLGELEIPESLHALIAARLDALPSEDRALLQDAAVLGKSFTSEGLSAVASVGPEALEPRLRELVQREFLVQESDPRSPERGQYAFLQSLIREVAYATLSKADRRRRHLATAHHFESLEDDELAGIVAAHYVEAFRATPKGPDADALAARARDWLGQAAERAQSLGSPEQALTYVDEALSITGDGAERAALLYQAGDAAGKAARPERAVEYLDEAIALFRLVGDATGVARATARQAGPLLLLDRGAEAAERMESALADLGAEGDERARAELCSGLADRYVSSGSSERGLRFAEQALAIAERLDLLDLLAEVVLTKASALFNVGRHRESVMLTRGALSLAEEMGSQRARSFALLYLGITLNEDDPNASLQASLDSAEAARLAGERFTELINLANAVEAAVDIGRWDDGDAALAELGERELPGFVGEGVELGRVMLAAFRGAPADAEDRLREMEGTLLATDVLATRTWFLRTRSVVRLLSGDLDLAYEDGMRAIEEDPAGMNTPRSVWSAVRAALWMRDPVRVRTAIDAMGPLRGRWIDVARRTAEAGLAAIEGRVQEATQGFAEALDIWSAMDLPLDYAFAAIDAVTLLPPELVPEGTADRARGILERLGAAPLLRRLSEAELRASATEQPAQT